MNRFSFILLLLCVTAHASTRKCKEDVMTNQDQAPSSRAKSPDFDTAIIPTDEAELVRRINPYAKTMARQNANIARMARIDIDDLHQEILSAAMIAWRKWDPEGGAGWFGWVKGGIDIKLRELASDAKGELDLGLTHAMSEFPGEDMDSVPLPLANTAQKTELNPLAAKHLAEEYFIGQTPEDADILRWHVVHGKTPEEIAAQTGESVTRIQRLIEHWPDSLTDQIYLDRAKKQMASFIGSTGEIQYFDLARLMRAHYVDGLDWDKIGLGIKPKPYARKVFRAGLMEYLRRHTLRPEYDPLFWSDSTMEAVITEALGRLGTLGNRRVFHSYFVEKNPIAAVAKQFDMSESFTREICQRASVLLHRKPRVVSYRNAWLEALSSELVFPTLMRQVLARFSEHEIAIMFYHLIEKKSMNHIVERFEIDKSKFSELRNRFINRLDNAVEIAAHQLSPPLNQVTIHRRFRHGPDSTKNFVSSSLIESFVENMLREIPYNLQDDAYDTSRVLFLRDLAYLVSKRYGITISRDQVQSFLRTLLPPQKPTFTPAQSKQWVLEFLISPKDYKKSRPSKHLDDELIRIIQHRLGLLIRAEQRTIPKHILFNGRLPTSIVRLAIEQTLLGRSEAVIEAFVQRFFEGKTIAEIQFDSNLGKTDQTLKKQISLEFSRNLSKIIEDARSRIPPEDIVEMRWTELVGLPLLSSDSTHQQARAIFEHIFNHKTLADAGRDSGFTRERVRQLVQATDERVAAWISANKTDLTRVTIDTSADMRSAFLIQRKKGKNLTPQAANQIDRARKYLPDHHRTLIGLQLDENKVVSEIVERFASQGKITDAATVTQDIKSAKGVLEDLLFAVKTIDAYPPGALPYSESEALTLIRVYREMSGTNTLPPIGELKSALRDIQTALGEMDKTANAKVLSSTLRALYREHRSLRELASSTVTVAQWRARQRELIAWIKKTAKWTQPLRR